MFRPNNLGPTLSHCFFYKYLIRFFSYFIIAQIFHIPKKTAAILRASQKLLQGRSKKGNGTTARLLGPSKKKSYGKNAMSPCGNYSR